FALPHNATLCQEVRQHAGVEFGLALVPRTQQLPPPRFELAVQRFEEDARIRTQHLGCGGDFGGVDLDSGHWSLNLSRTGSPSSRRLSIPYSSLIGKVISGPAPMRSH